MKTNDHIMMITQELVKAKERIKMLEDILFSIESVIIEMDNEELGRETAIKLIRDSLRSPRGERRG